MPAAVELGALLFQLRQFLVPQRTRGAGFGLLGVGAGDLPVPAGQRQFEQGLAERLELAVRRLVRGRDLGDQGAQIEIEAAIEGALGRVAVHRGQDDAGDGQDHHQPCRRRQEQAGGKRASAHQGTIQNSVSGAPRGDGRAPVFGQDHAQRKQKK